VAPEAIDLEIQPTRRDPGVCVRVPIQSLELGHDTIADDDADRPAVLDETTLEVESAKAP
jgi:hypothetical protein